MCSFITHIYEYVCSLTNKKTVLNIISYLFERYIHLSYIYTEREREREKEKRE